MSTQPVRYRTTNLNPAVRRQVNPFKPTIRSMLREYVLSEEPVFTGSLAFSTLLAGAFVFLIHIADHQEKVRFLPRPDNAYSTELLVDMPYIEKNPNAGGDGDDDKAVLQKGLDDHLTAATDYTQQFKDTGTSNIDWGTFFISSEYYAQHLEKETYLMPTLKLNELLAIFSRDANYFNSIVADPSMSRLDKLKWLKQYVYSKSVYDPGAHVITSLMYENGGQNCQTRTKYLLALAAMHGAKLLEPGERFVVAAYRPDNAIGHHELGIYNENSGALILFDDLNKAATTWEGDLYDPHFLLQGFLDHNSWDKGRFTDYAPYLIAKANIETEDNHSNSGPEILGPFSKLSFAPQVGSKHRYSSGGAQPLTREAAKSDPPPLPINEQLVQEFENSFNTLHEIINNLDPGLSIEKREQAFKTITILFYHSVKLIEGAGVFPPGDARLTFDTGDFNRLIDYVFGSWGSGHLAHLPKKEQEDFLRSLATYSKHIGFEEGGNLIPLYATNPRRLILTTDEVPDFKTMANHKKTLDKPANEKPDEPTSFFDRDLFVSLFIHQQSSFYTDVYNYMTMLRLDKDSARYVKKQLINEYKNSIYPNKDYGYGNLERLFTSIESNIEYNKNEGLSVEPDAWDSMLLVAYRLYLRQLTMPLDPARSADLEYKRKIEALPLFKQARATYIRLVGKDSFF